MAKFSGTHQGRDRYYKQDAIDPNILSCLGDSITSRFCYAMPSFTRYHNTISD
ncbi:hypothetical protein [Scytonema sp. NUACC21]